MNKLCVISMSGGLDSTTLARKAIEDGYTILPLNIKYGQKNVVEMQSFKRIHAFLEDQFPDQVLAPIVLDLESMLETSLGLYKSIRDSGQVKDATEMEFYTPSRNLVFSTLAAMIGEIGAIASNQTEVLIGLGVHKHSEVYPRDYWDISPEFVSRLNHLFELNKDVSVKMYAPYVDKFKSDIIEDTVRLGIPFNKTWTCYNPIESHYDKTLYKYEPCLKCEACLERQAAGDKAGIPHINNYFMLVNKLREVYSATI